MKKKLIGTCPCCGQEAAIDLSSFLELPIGIPCKCELCGTLLRVSPERQKLSRVAKIVSYLIVYSLYWSNGQSAAAFGFGILGFLLAFVFINRTIGRPILTVYKPERDFLKEELEDDGVVNPK